MRNVKILLQYDGTNYKGWQIQPKRVTIQGLLTGILTRLDDRSVIVHGAGRTDTGVHAEGQVASFSFRREMTQEQLLRALNGKLPPDIRVRDVAWVEPEFHARRSAKSKTYRYIFFLGRVISPFIYRYVHPCYYPISIDRMQDAAALFVGEHDFAAFSLQSQERTTTVRRLMDVKLTCLDESLELHVTANGFLRAMVRRIAGTLQDIGRGLISLDQLRALLQGDVSLKSGSTLPAKGLTLLRVDY